MARIAPPCAVAFATALLTTPLAAQDTISADTASVRTLVSRLELERYKATIKGLTQFGDRRQGTERNRRAVDWIEAQLKSYGCTNTERIKYTYEPPQRQQPQPRPPGEVDQRAPRSAERGASERGRHRHRHGAGLHELGGEGQQPL